jgi:glycerol uptake facilitator-like aquaporin
MLLKQTLALIAAAVFICSSANAADTYKIDPAHTTITFSVRHLGINSVKGQFKEFEGAIVLDDGVIKEARERFRSRVWIRGLRNGMIICGPLIFLMSPITPRSRSRQNAS